MVFWLEVDAGSHIARHSHPNEQITWLLEGRFDIQIGDDPARSCGPGSVLLIPGNTPHEAWYREKCRIVEFFSPPRFDLFPAAAGNPYGLPEA
jgi:quercetin dioxygenase-like cupin family protein